MYAMPDIPPGSLENKRDALLRRLLNEKPYGRNAVTVVFDSREGGGQKSRQGEAGIVFTAGETADDWIIRYVRTEKNPRILRVVTDDQGICRMIRGTGAQSMGTQEFWKTSRRSRDPEPSEPTKPESDSITAEFKKKWL